MELQINKYIDTVKEAWYDLIDDYRNIGEKSGYGHMREEDMRSYLFCKIMNLLSGYDEPLFDLHAEVPMNGKTIDLALGLEEDMWKVGIEIKRTGNIQVIKKDLDKLRNFIENKKLGAGVFVAIVKHSYNLKDIFYNGSINTIYELEERDTRGNNFIEWNRILVDRYNVDWDTLLIVLRKFNK